jgi:hypothetical protein
MDNDITTVKQQPATNWKQVFTLVPNRKSDGKDFFCRIGTAFFNRDGSITLDLWALPRTDFKMQLRDRDERFERKPHPLDPVDAAPPPRARRPHDEKKDPFADLPLPPVIQ